MIITRKLAIRTMAVLALTVAVSTTGHGSTEPARAAADRRVISDGHVDMGPRVVDGEWKLQLRDDTDSPSVWRDLDTLVLHGSEDTSITVPEDDAYSFLGAAGDSTYVFPQTQRAGVVWPGWNTQDPSVVDGVTGDVTWTIRDVTGPGDFDLFLTDSFGSPSLIFDSDEGYPQSTTIGTNVHVHGNWAFSKAGVYQIQMQMSATSSDGQAFTDTQTLYMAVATSAEGIPVGSSSTQEESDGSTPDPSDSAGSGSSETSTGAGSSDVSNGELPNTGAGMLPPLAGSALVALFAGVLLRRLGRRRAQTGAPARD